MSMYKHKDTQYFPTHTRENIDSRSNQTRTFWETYIIILIWTEILLILLTLLIGLATVTGVNLIFYKSNSPKHNKAEKK